LLVSDRLKTAAEPELQLEDLAFALAAPASGCCHHIRHGLWAEVTPGLYPDQKTVRAGQPVDSGGSSGRRDPCGLVACSGVCVRHPSVKTNQSESTYTVYHYMYFTLSKKD